MDEFQNHYHVLGLPYGAGADEVKKAFRSKIKEHHPDTATAPEDSAQARKLIEAYQALKKGPPPPRYTSQPSGRGPGPQTAESAGPSRPERAAPGTSEYERGRAAGERLYEKIFGQKGPMDDFWDRLSDLVYGDPSDAEIYGENIDVREYIHRAREGNAKGPFRNPFENQVYESYRREKARREHEARIRRERTQKKEPPRKEDPPYGKRRHWEHYTDPANGSLDQARVYFNRAETLLKETVFKYDRKENLKRKIWLKEYLGRLTNVQVLFRDVANRHPTYYARAQSRINQIKELSSEIRQML